MILVMQPILFYNRNMFNLKLENLCRISLVDIIVPSIDEYSYFKVFFDFTVFRKYICSHEKCKSGNSVFCTGIRNFLSQQMIQSKPPVPL